MDGIGGPVTLGVKIKDSAGVLTNATTITLVIQQPDLATVTPSVTNPPTTTGLYSYVFTPTQAGHHEARWTTTGPAVPPFVDSFDVAETWPPLIVGLSEAKSFLELDPDDDTVDEDELRRMIEGVTAVVEGVVGPVVRRTVTTTLYPTGTPMLLPYFPILSLTSAAQVSDSTVVDLTGYTFDNGVLSPPWATTGPWQPFTVTYVVGRPDLPANIRMGALEILKLAWDSQRGTEAPSFLIPYRAQAWLAPDRQFGVA